MESGGANRTALPDWLRPPNGVAKQNRAARRPPEAEGEANRVLAEVPASAAAKVATAEAAHVAAAKAAKVTTAKAAGVADAERAEVAGVSVREPRAVSVEAVVEMATVEAGAKAKPKAAVVTVVAVVRIVAVVAPAVWPGVVIVAGRRITGRDSANHSSPNDRAGIIAIAVSVAVSVSPNVVAMAGVSVSHLPVQAVRDTRVSDMRLSDMPIVSGMLIMTSDSRRIRGG
jgi:hypothetical protein